MLRWYLTAIGLTASNQSLACFYLLFSAQYKVISIMNSIKSMQKSCFLVFHYLNSITFFAGDGGSDFLFSQILASPEQISFSLVFF